MKSTEKIIYTICIGLYLVGFNILFSWTENSKVFGLALIFAASIAVYRTYKSSNKYSFIYVNQKINFKNISLGLLLILVDITYNLFTSGKFDSLDQGMLGSGIAIILLNTGLLRFLKISDLIISFSSYFLFLVISIYAFMFLIPREIFFNKITNLSGSLAAFFLNFIGPTSTYVVINYPNIYNLMVNFDGKVIGIGDACSGVTMLTVFIAAVIAFHLSSKKRNFRKLLINASLGVIIFYFINVIRLIILILINYHYGPETMYFFHVNLGWIMFILGMGTFWYFELDRL